MDKEFLSFDDAMEQLVVESDDLKRMVSEGEIRAYREYGEVKFRSDDIAALKEGMDTEPTIELVGDESAGDASDTVTLQTQPSTEFVELTAADFEDEIEIIPTTADVADPPAQTEEILDRMEELEDTVTDLTPPAAGVTDTVVAQPDEEETFVLAEDDGLSQTVPLELLDDEKPAMETGGTTAVVGVSEIQTPDMLGMPRVASGQNPIMLAILLFSTLILVFGSLLVISFVTGTSLGLTDAFADIFR